MKTPAVCLLMRPENKQRPIISPLFQITPPRPNRPPCVVDLLDEGVVLLPEGHGGDVGVVLVSAWPALALLPPTWDWTQVLR